MKRSSSFAGFRWFLILILVIGILLASVYFLPFETIADRLNSLASDGEFASFNREVYEDWRVVVGIFGSVLVTLSAWMLVKWTITLKGLNWCSSRLGELNLALREDARNYFKMSGGETDKRTSRIILGLVLVAVIMRLASLNIPLIHDEAYTYNAFASESLWHTISDYHMPNNHVLLSITINILTHLFGNHLWLIRLPTIVAGVLMVPASYVLGKRFYSREAGILSAAWVAVFPILITYSVLARGYAFLNLITLVALILGDRVRQDKNRFVWLLLAFVNALGFFTIPIMMFPFGALYLWLFLSGIMGDIGGYRSKPDFLRYWLASGLASAVLTVLFYMPILVNNFELFFGNRFVAPLNRDLFNLVFWSRVQLTWTAWTETIPGWIVLLGMIGFAAGIILHFQISKQRVPLQMSFFLWIAAFVILRRPDMMSRMWLFLAAPLLIWSAGGIVESLKLFSKIAFRKLPLAQIFVGISVFAVVAVGVFTIPTIPQRWEQKSSIENAAIYLRDNLYEGDLVTANTAYFPQLRYYFEIHDIPHEYLRRSGQFRRMFIVMGERGKETLETVVPVDGANRPVVNMNTLRIVLEFDDLIIYEGDFAP